MHILYRKVNVLGLTRETVYALTTGIESIEWRRRSSTQQENPRSGTTDDVECIFSIMRDIIGKHFTLRQVRYAWRKICVEFSKRLDPDLRYYYFTSSHDRFFEGERPGFDEPPTKRQSSGRSRRREQPGHLMIGRATLPQPGSRSTRMTFHNLPLELPPPPGTSSHISDHTYC